MVGKTISTTHLQNYFILIPVTVHKSDIQEFPYLDNPYSLAYKSNTIHQ